MSKVIDILNEAVEALGRTELYKDLSDLEKYVKVTGLTWVTEEMLANEELEEKLCWMIPAGAAFCTGECTSLSEEEVAEVIAALKAGGEVKLTDNLKYEGTIQVASKTEPTTLDLNGKSIITSRPESDQYGDGINCATGTTVTIKGGKIDNLSSGPAGAAVMVKGTAKVTLEEVDVISNGYPVYLTGQGDVTIKSGSFTADNTTAAVYLNAAGGHVTVLGGTFQSKDYNGRNYCLNLKDGLDISSISVQGGTFIGFNPAASMGEPNGPVSFVAEGFKVIYKGDTYKVVAEDAAVPAGWTEYVAPVAEEPIAAAAVEPVVDEAEPEVVEATEVAAE